MHSRTHLITSAITGIIFYPRSPLRIALVIAGGVLIDVDHYVLYAQRSGDWSLAGALRYERRRHVHAQAGDTRPRYGSLRSSIHLPWLVLPIVWLLGLVWAPIRPAAIGLTLHLALDLHYPQYDPMLWKRADERCEYCGLPGLDLTPQYLVPPHRGGKRWDHNNLVIVCSACAKKLGRQPLSQRRELVKKLARTAQ